jgi:transcriptional regulator GlxA family with amidase domain
VQTGPSLALRGGVRRRGPQVGLRAGTGRRHLGGELVVRLVEVAQQLLDSTTLSTTEIAYCAGFGTRRTFFRVFRRITGMTPAQFRSPPEAA